VGSQFKERHRLHQLRKIFGPKKDEVNQQYRALNTGNNELIDLYRSPSTARVSSLESWDNGNKEHIQKVGGEESLAQFSNNFSSHCPLYKS
jgi:hypothetical protein